MESAEDQNNNGTQAIPPIGGAVAAALLASILFSGKGILTKAGMAHGSTALDMLALRMGLAAPLYGAILFWSLRNQPIAWTDLGRAVLQGLLGCYLCPTLNFYGLQTVSASLERVLIHVIPAMVIVVAWVKGSEKATRNTAIALTICYTGVALSCMGRDHGRDSADFGGVAAILASGLLYAIFLVQSVGMQKRVGAITFTSAAMFTSSIVILLQNVIQGKASTLLHPPAGVLPIAIVLATLCTVAPAYLSAYGIKVLGAGRSSVLAMIGPLLTPFAAALALGERMSPPQIAGFSLVFTGGILLSRKGS